MPRRDWKRINEALVRRGELLLDLDFVKGWGGELQSMNEGKEGARFRYPDSFIRLLLFMHAYLHLPYRQLEGFTKALARYVKGLKAPDHSSIQWRAEKLPVTFDHGVMDSNEDVVIAVDVKGKKILALKVTDERTGDGRMLKPLAEDASQNVHVSKTIADGAYDTKANFRYLSAKGIDPVIKVRKNSSTRARGCMPRKLVAHEYLKDPTAWKRHHGYGYRWMAETAISSYKRGFGEYVTAKTMENMARELVVKASLYNLFTGLTANL